MNHAQVQVARAVRDHIAEDSAAALQLMRFRGHVPHTDRRCLCGQLLDETDLEWCAQCGRDRGTR